MNKTRKNYSLDQKFLLELINVNLSTPEGRPLFHDLNMVLERKKVAVIGRNGVGKSSLLNTISGNLQPDSGDIRYYTKPYLVPQEISLKNNAFLQVLPSLFPEQVLAEEFRDAGLTSFHVDNHSTCLSYGELRKLYLLTAKLSCPDMLLLDEPTEDLDEAGVKWLVKWISSWPDGLLMVSHDRVLLSHFEHFFIITESGCSYFYGTFSELARNLEHKAEEAETRYIHNLHILARKEEHRAKILRRRRRKKNFGRISELERCTPKQRLNKKRSNAQVSQGKAAKISQDRINTIRAWTLASRRALAVNLPLELPVPHFDVSRKHEIVRLKGVSAKINQRFLFKHVDLSLGFERLAIVGPNGAGKTTLLNIIAGNIKPFEGSAAIVCQPGFIAQGGANWMCEESLLSLLMIHSQLQTLNEVAQLLLMHKFPIALASRQLCSLSPGERVRAALICLFQQAPEILLLDEPTYSLDFTGETSLRKALKAWPGALIMVSHNSEFLTSTGVFRRLVLNGKGRYVLS